MPFQYRLVFDIAQRLQKSQLKHLQSLEPEKSVQEITSRQVNGWSVKAVHQQDVFTAITDTETTTEPETKGWSYDIPQDQEEHVNPASKHSSVDWRFSAIEVTGIDMDQPVAAAAAADQGEPVPAMPARSKSFSNGGVEFLKGKFMGYGVVRLYKDSDLVDDDDNDEEALYDKPSSTTATAAAAATAAKPKADQPTSASIHDETVLAILAVPSYLTPYDFLGFIGAGFRPHVSHFRMVRTALPNRYMVLLKFRTSARAHEFYKEFNGRPFNAMEAETCQAVFVESVRFKRRGGGSGEEEEEEVRNSEIPYLLEDPFTVADQPDTATATATAPTEGGRTRRVSQSQPQPQLSPRPVPPPTPALTELPTCPVCLERMDATITGLLTIPCQHTFHCQCLSKWQDGSCPVCRYSQRDTSVAGGAHGGRRNCAVCQASENLWICLICGHIGCGRYDQAHAYDHYEVTGHCYAMDMASQRVWDYVSDGYVHRLLQNQVDGKLVELPESGSSRAGPRGAGSSGGGSAAADVAAAAMKAAETSEKKLDDVGLQFAQLLSSQLDSQRDYYESLLASAADKASSALKRATAAEAENASLQQTQLQLQTQTLPELERSATKSAAKAAKYADLYGTARAQLDDELAMSAVTLAKLQRLETETAEREAEMAELREQVRDLMFFHEAQAKLAGAGEEVVEGQVVVGPAPGSGKGKRKKKK